jgi:predicted ATPase
MQGKRLLQSITLRQLLSYGQEGVSIELEPLNVLIGPNASGKSNLIEAISLLAAAPRDIHDPIRKGGGVLEWIWKGAEYGGAELSVLIEYNETVLRYGIRFREQDSRFLLLSEILTSGHHRKDVIFALGRKMKEISGGDKHLLDSLDENKLVLAQLRDPVNHPEITAISLKMGDIRIFRGWSFGRDSELRRPQRVDLPDDFLLEDGSNLGLVLNNLKNRPRVKRSLLERLRLFYNGIEDFDTKVQGGTIQVFMHEKGDRIISSTRLSDGTLHYLCLLAILCHPEPPPLICIEEPELGLHPDILPTVGDLLTEAAQRTQLIVTSHSETLVSKLSEVPESVIVCERDERGTSLRRLDRPKLEEWLERYTLGELWRMGEIGGNRW